MTKAYVANQKTHESPETCIGILTLHKCLKCR